MKGLYFILFFWVQCIFGQVGINTTNPQQTLHIAGASQTMRVESLNAINNGFNGGGGKVYPLYVDENGDFLLELRVLQNSGEFDAINNSELPGASINLPGTDTDGEEKSLITEYQIEVNRAALLEIKYNISFEVFATNALDKISDNKARRIQNYIRITGDLNNDDVFEYSDPREYGPNNKCYSSGSNNSIEGTMYNSSTAYINIPSPGTYNIRFIGLISSNIKSGSAGGPQSQQTYVKFATGNDMVFFRLH